MSSHRVSTPRARIALSLLSVLVGLGVAMARAWATPRVVAITPFSQRGPLPGTCVMREDGTVLAVSDASGSIRLALQDGANDAFYLVKPGFRALLLYPTQLHENNYFALDPEPVGTLENLADTATASVLDPVVQAPELVQPVVATADPVVVSPEQAQKQASEPKVEPSSGENEATYVVRRGDSLWTVAHHNMRRLHQLRRLNPRVHGDRLKPGMVLKLPASAHRSAPPPASEPASPSITVSGDADEAPRTTPTPATPESGGTYIVQPGDSLWSISHGDPTFWYELARLNKTVLGPDQKLMPGMTLVLPVTRSPVSK